MWTVLETKAVLKVLKRCPKEILKEYLAWKRVIELSGPRAVHLIPGYRDHVLSGQWQGARSSALNYKWRVIYIISEVQIQIKVLEVTPHDYRKKD